MRLGRHPETLQQWSIFLLASSCYLGAWMLRRNALMTLGSLIPSRGSHPTTWGLQQAALILVMFDQPSIYEKESIQRVRWLCRSSWTEVKQDRGRPKARYAHSMARMDSRVFLFGGETNTGAALILLPTLSLPACAAHSIPLPLSRPLI